MQQIANTDNLGGKLMIVESPSDAELAALYDGCLFTLMPSLFEGWGLPVTESLGFGKPCMIANRTSLPEAGGDMVRSFDPDNLNDAYAVIRDTIEDRAGLALWEPASGASSSRFPGRRRWTHCWPDWDIRCRQCYRRPTIKKSAAHCGLRCQDVLRMISPNDVLTYWAIRSFKCRSDE